MDRKTLSIVVPLHNEERNIPIVYGQIRELFKGMPCSLELVFVNDGSQDKSQEVIKSLASGDSRIKYLEFSRNFGKEAATTAGLRHSSGDAVVIIDADLQHPARLISEFHKLWLEGYDVVIGRRIRKTTDSPAKKVLSSLYYRIMALISDIEIMAGATDFRLLDRKVVNEFSKLTERARMTRGLIDWLGFRKTYVEFVEEGRLHGKPSYTHAKLIKLALSSFVAHSLFPLKFAGYLGLLIVFMSGTGGMAVLVETYVFGDALNWGISGSAKLALLLIFLTGVTLSCLGLIALYVGNIHGEVSGRPLYVVKSGNLPREAEPEDRS